MSDQVSDGSLDLTLLRTFLAVYRAGSITAGARALGLSQPNLWLPWLLLTVGQMLALAWLGPVITAVQHIVLPSMRATASASFLFINNLIGIVFGIYFLGALSDAMKAAHGEDSLQYSILYGLSFYLLAAVFYLFASVRLGRDIKFYPSLQTAEICGSA